MGKPSENVFGQTAEGRELAAIDRQERRDAKALVEHERIVAADVLRPASAVVIKGTHAGIRPDYIGCGDADAEVGVDRVAKIVDFLLRRCGHGGLAGKALIDGADQGVGSLEGNGENDAAVARLQNICSLVIVKARHDNVAALVEPELSRRRLPQQRLPNRFHPGARGIDQHSSGHHIALAARVEDQAPDVGLLGADATRTGADCRPSFGGVDRVERDETRIVGEAIRILVGAVKTALERLPGGGGDEIKGTRAGQDLAPAEQVVDQKTEPEHQRRAARGIQRQHETERLDEVRRHPQQHLTLAERSAHEA